jgi:hypothetical protein
MANKTGIPRKIKKLTILITVTTIRTKTSCRFLFAMLNPSLIHSSIITIPFVKAYFR